MHMIHMGKRGGGVPLASFQVPCIVTRLPPSATLLVSSLYNVYMHLHTYIIVILIWKCMRPSFIF